MQNEEQLDEALGVVNRVIETGDTSGLPPEVAASFKRLFDAGYTDSEMKHMMLLSLCMKAAIQNIDTPSDVLGGNPDLLRAFFKSYSTIIYDDYKDEFVDVYTYGALMMSLGALLGVDFTERRHA